MLAARCPEAPVLEIRHGSSPWSRRQESNLYLPLRRRLFYPLELRRAGRIPRTQHLRRSLPASAVPQQAPEPAEPQRNSTLAASFALVDLGELLAQQGMENARVLLAQRRACWFSANSSFAAFGRTCASICSSIRPGVCVIAFQALHFDAIGLHDVSTAMSVCRCGKRSAGRAQGRYCQRQLQITSSELSAPDCARSVKRWAMR